MTQQINLYHAGLRQQRRWGLREAVFCLAAVTAGCLAAAAALEMHARRLSAQATAAQAVLAERQLQWQALQDGRVPLRLPSTGPGTDGMPGPLQLEREVLRLRAAEAGRRRLSSLLDSAAAGHRRGYSAHLVSLSRQAHPQVWLTSVTLDAAGEPLELQGRLSDPAALTAWLDGLSRESAFQGRRFGQLQLRRLDPGDAVAGTPQAEPVGAGPITAFSLRSTAGAATPARPALPGMPPVTAALLDSAQAGLQVKPPGGTLP